MKDGRMLQHHTDGFKDIEYDLAESDSMAMDIQIRSAPP